MQRGALLRSDGPQVTNADLYEQSPPLLTDDELVHFQFGNRSIDAFFLGVSDILLACHQSRQSAGEVSRVLNKAQVRTACGEAWTPRLAWFLMKTWRTVHFEKQALARQRAQDSRRIEPTPGPERVDDTPIERAARRQSAASFQRVLKTYFKNPTLGEIFPQLGALKTALQAQEAPVPASQKTPRSDISHKPRSHPVEPPPKTKSLKQGKAKDLANSREPKPMPSAPLQLSGPWKAFLESGAGRTYMADLVRVHRRLLDLAPIETSPLLGYLRSWKVSHPIGRYWTTPDALQLRLAILERLHRERLK